MQRLEEKDSLCQHQTIDLKSIAQELTIIPMAIVGNPQHGKTTLAKHLVEALTELPNVKVRVWDSSTKWLFNSPCSKVFVIPPPQIVVYSDTDSYQSNEMLAYSETITHEEMTALLKESCICFDSSELDDIEYERQIQQQLIHIDKQRLIRQVKQNKGIVKESVVWVCEESQGVFSSNSLRKKQNLWLARCISTSANYGLSWLVITRRASEVSTKIFEHTGLKAIANSTQPNSLRKLKTILEWQDIERLRTFGIGQFLVQNKEGIHYLQTTKFNGKDPMILQTEQPQEETEDKGFLARLFKW